LGENQSAVKVKKSKNRGVTHTSSSTPSFSVFFACCSGARPPALRDLQAVALAQANPEQI
jgi:hypothetical protein